MRIAKCSWIPALVTLGLLSAWLPSTEGATRFLARSWQSEDGLPSNVLRGVVQATDGYLWVGTAEGIVRFDGQRFTGFPADSELARQSVRSLYPLANGDVWITTAGNLLIRGRGARLEEVSLPPSTNSAALHVVTQVALSKNGDVFVVRDAEVWQIADGKVARAAERNVALDKLLQDDLADKSERGRGAQSDSTVQLRGLRGEVWDFRPGTGLTHTDLAGNTEPVSMQIDPPSSVRAMMQDREGNLWLSTGTQGLWRLRPARVDVLSMANGLSDRTVRLGCEDREGALWIAPNAGGLDCLSAGEARRVEVGSTPTRQISALLETHAGSLWAAIRDGQVYALQDGNFNLALPKDRPVARVLTMTEDKQGLIWLGRRNGLSVWDGNEARNMDLGGTENVMSVISAGSTIWAGTESGKVYRGSADGRFVMIAGAEAFARQPISDLRPDTDGSVWIGTIGGGLFYFRADHVEALATRMTEVDPRITCVLDDGAGFLWLGTLGGICRVNKAKLLGSHSPVPGSTLVFDRSDGMLTRECTRGGQPAGWRGRDGTLYFSTGDGVAYVHPDRLVINTVPPPVAIEEASANDRPLSPDAGRVQVGPGRSRLEFRFTALSLTTPRKVRFRTRLEGLDEAWRDAGNQRTAVYESVPPGRYVFRVTAENGDGIWNETGAALSVDVLRHFWETRWFQSLVALLTAALAVGVGALVMRARMRGRLLRLEAQTSREKERARIAQDLHDDLGASLTEISLLANLALEERGANSKDDDTLPEVAVKAQALVGALDEIVWAVNPRHDTLRSLAEYLAAFAGKFLGRAGIALRRDVPRDLPEMNFDAERRHNIFLAVREVLNNVVKHSGASEAWLRLRIENRRLELVVEDNGRGFDPAIPRSGNGVGNVSSRLARIDGKCQIESHPGGGTKVLLSLPV